MTFNCDIYVPKEKLSDQMKTGWPLRSYSLHCFVHLKLIKKKVIHYKENRETSVFNSLMNWERTFWYIYVFYTACQLHNIQGTPEWFMPHRWIQRCFVDCSVECHNFKALFTVRREGLLVTGAGLLPTHKIEY